MTHSHALKKPWDTAVTRRLGASARVLPSWVLLYASRTRNCAQPLLSETFKVGRPFSATNSFETFTHWKISQRNQCFTSQIIVHQPVVDLERIASRFSPPLKRWLSRFFAVKSSLFDTLLVPGTRLRSKNPRRRRGASKAHFVIWRYDAGSRGRFIRREFLTFASPFLKDNIEIRAPQPA